MLFVFLLHIDERLAVAVGDGALERKEDENDRFLVLEIVEREALILIAVQDEIGNSFTELGARRAAGKGGRGDQNETQKRRENSPHGQPHKERRVWAIEPDAGDSSFTAPAFGGFHSHGTLT